jgi:hypothetical protein
MAPSVKQRKIAILGSRSVGEHPIPSDGYTRHMASQTARSRTDPDHRSTGKSSLTVQYCEGHFVESYYPTIENTFSHEIVYKGQTFLTEIIDTAGQVRHTQRRQPAPVSTDTRITG